MNNSKLLPDIYNLVNNNEEIKEILNRIDELKLKMSELWEERGSIDPDVEELSIKLDKLLNQYYKLIKDNDG